MKVGNKILGLAIGQKNILVAEVQQRNGRNVVSHCADFEIPADMSLSQPDKLGLALQNFLRVKNITARDVIIGLPAKRLVTRRKEVPAAPAAVAASTLRLQAEGEFSSELDNLVMDFAGTPSPAQSTTVLLVATNKVVIDECEAMARAAGLRIHAITSTTVALGRATSRLPGGDGLVLNLATGSAELVVQHGLDPAHLRHLNVGALTGADGFGMLAGEIKRTMASIPRNGTPQTLAIWNAPTGSSPQSVLEQRLAIPVTTQELRNLVTSEAPNAEAFVPAIAVALVGMEDPGPAIDFLHSRLAPPREPVISTQNKILIGAGILLAGLTAFLVVDLHGRQTQLDNVQKQLSAKTTALQEADLYNKRLEEARKRLPNIDGRSPTYVAVLRDLTGLFPAQGGTIWATGLANVRDNYTWEVQGKSINQTFPSEVANLMLKSDRFSNPRLGTAYEQAGNVYGFRLQFNYHPPGTTQPATSQVATSVASLPYTAPASNPSSQPARTPEPTPATRQ